MSKAEKLPFKAGIFDKVVCNCSLEHFKNDIDVLREINRVVKPEGLIALTVDSFTYHGISNEDRELHRKKHGVVNYYDLQKIKKKMEQAGFIVDRNKYYMHSPISSFLVRHIIIRHNIPFALMVLLSWLVLPICIISDRITGSKDEGYFLAIRGKNNQE